MASTKEAIAIVLDVGASMQNDKCSPSVLEEAKSCVHMIIQRKILSESKDEIALLLFGIAGSEDELSEEEEKEADGYANIAIVRKLQLAGWDLLDYINEIKGTSVSTDFIRANALLSAIDVLQDATSKKKFASRRIIFISNFDGFICSEKVDEICDEMKRHSIDLNVIGPNAFATENTKIESDMDQCDDAKLDGLKAENAITKILYEVNGDSYSFNDVRHALTFYQMKKKQPYPWNANIEFGSLFIPVSAFIKVTEVKSEAWKKCYTFKPDAKIETRYTYNMNDESQTEISKEDLIPAFKYGTTLVPFSEEDKRNMSYEPGERGIKILGFAKSKDVQRYHYIGDNTMYVFGRKNDEIAGTHLAAFVKALHDTKMVAVVRYVYNQRCSPKLGFLSPKIKENYECLIFVALPFMEDLRHFVFSPLDADSKNIPTEEQLDAIDELINNMDLTVPIQEDDEELLKPKSTVNPYLQRLFQCLEFRALNPEKPLPDIEDNIKTIVTPSTELLKRAEKSVKKLASLYPLKQAEVKQKGARSNRFLNGKNEESVKKEAVGDDSLLEEKYVPEISLIDAVTDKITEVGSINPVRDFQHLVNNNVLPFNDICEQLMDVVFKYLKDTACLKMYYSKILSICKEFKHASLKEKNCEKYNFFMTNLKNILLETEDDLWEKIKTEKIGLISNQELPSSTVSSEQAEKFLASPSLTDKKDASSNIEPMEMNDDDDEDLLDML